MNFHGHIKDLERAKNIFIFISSKQGTTTYSLSAIKQILFYLFITLILISFYFFFSLFSSFKMFFLSFCTLSLAGYTLAMLRVAFSELAFLRTNQQN